MRSPLWRRHRDSGASAHHRGQKRGGSGDPALRRSRGGCGTKVPVRVEGTGQPVAFRLTPGPQHKATVFEEWVFLRCADIKFGLVLPAQQSQQVHPYRHAPGVSLLPPTRPIQLAAPYRMQPLIPVHGTILGETGLPFSTLGNMEGERWISGPYRRLSRRSDIPAWHEPHILCLTGFPHRMTSQASQAPFRMRETT